MEKRCKNRIRQAADDPDPAAKDAFIRTYRRLGNCREMRSWDILKSQAAYIRKSVWMISLFALLLAVVELHAGSRHMIMMVSAWMPFVSGIAVIETFRSELHSMTELESATKLSIRGILFARIICIGTVHIILILLLTVLMARNSGHGYWMTGAMITIPYLLSSVVSMEVERTAFGRRNAFVCIIISVFTAFLAIMLQGRELYFAEGYREIWYLAAMLLLAAECHEVKKTFRSVQIYGR